MLLTEKDLADYKELEDVIKKCLQEMQASNLTCLKAQKVVSFLNRKIMEAALGNQL